MIHVGSGLTRIWVGKRAMENGIIGETVNTSDARVGSDPNENNFNGRSLCQIRSKALDMSSQTGWVSPSLSRAADQVCDVTARSHAEQWEQNPYRRSLSTPPGSRKRFQELSKSQKWGWMGRGLLRSEESSCFGIGKNNCVLPWRGAKYFGYERKKGDGTV